MNPALEETIHVDFITSLPTTGAAADADSTPTAEVFEDATDTAILTPTVTKRTGKTGNYRVPIACTAVNGFEAAKSYNVVISATVGAVAAKAVVRSFQMRTNDLDDLAVSILTRASPAQVQTELGTYGALKPTTAGRTLDISTAGEAGIDWANIGGATTAQALSATTISTSQAVASVSGAVGSVTGAVGSVTSPVTLTAAYDAAKTAAAAGAAMALTAGERTTLTGVIWNILTSGLTTVGSIGKLLVDNINATIGSRSTYAGADTAGTTTLLSRIASALTITAGKVDVNDKTGFALTAAYDPAKTAMQAGAVVTVGTNNDKTGYALTAAYDAAKTAATQASVNTIDDFVDTEVGAIKIVTDKLDTALEVDGPVWRYTVNALEQAPAGGGGGATDWTPGERDQIRHRLGIDGSTLAPSTGDPSLASESDITALNTKLDAIDDFVDTEVTAIKAKTDQLQFTGSDVKATLDGETVSVSDKTGFSLAPEYNAAKTASSQASVDAVKVKVDNLPSDPVSTAAINASFATVNSGIAGVRGQTDKLSFVGSDVRATLDSEPVAVVMDSSDLIAIADAILKRDFSALTGEAAYSLLNAARMLRNVWDTTDGTLTVRKEDGATVAWTRELTTDPEAQPIVAAT